MSYFEFDKNIFDPKVKTIEIENLLTDKMVLISGDFWGIQKFIFERLSTKNAAKVLRSKSAFVQILTEYIAKYICNKLSIEEKYIISINAGKFEILAPFENVDISQIQTNIDDYFKKNYYGLNGVVLSIISCEKDDFLDKKRYRVLRDITIPKQIEKDKFHKFSLNKVDSLMQYDTNINNQSLCRVCNIRKTVKDNKCNICHEFIELGWKLTSNTNLYKVKLIDNFKTTIELTQKIRSYIPKDEKNKPLDFSKIAENSCKDNEHGIKALGVLKADVDGMGLFLQDANNPIIETFETFDHFSKGMDSFFSLYIPNKLEKKYPDIYTVFAGGDDLFLIGAWDEILEFAREIQDEFKKYVKNSLTLSFGIAITKPSTPISYLATHSEELLEDAKDIDSDKDAISLFKETVKWKNYIHVYDKLYKELNEFDKVFELKTTFLYRILELIELSRKAKNGDIKATIWKSKLSYLFRRNVLEKIKEKEKAEKFFKHLDNYIENNPKETKMVLSEFIYKRRDAK